MSFVDHLRTPIGMLALVTNADDAIEAIGFLEAHPRMQRWFAPTLVRRKSRSTGALKRYFDGDLDALSSVDVAPAGTEFQAKVWSELRRIPAGQTITYTELAARVRRPDAVRAVGAANGANPVNLVVPCHRVIASNGDLTGYAPGLPRKAWLLAHEVRHS